VEINYIESERRAENTFSHIFIEWRGNSRQTVVQEPIPHDTHSLSARPRARQERMQTSACWQQFLLGSCATQCQQARTSELESLQERFTNKNPTDKK